MKSNSIRDKKIYKLSSGQVSVNNIVNRNCQSVAEIEEDQERCNVKGNTQQFERPIKTTLSWREHSKGMNSNIRLKERLNWIVLVTVPEGRAEGFKMILKKTAINTKQHS